MKAILMSIRPQWVAKILNGEKTIEIRKKFPKDYVGWVYIYCTKDKKKHLYPVALLDKHNKVFKRGYKEDDIDNRTNYLNGKVVARFWCDKVEEVEDCVDVLSTKSLDCLELLQKSCLKYEELHDYLPSRDDDKPRGYAIHITKLEIFDKPKEISEFKHYKKFSEIDYMLSIPRKETCERLVALTRAPESYCFIEI